MKASPARLASGVSCVAVLLLAAVPAGAQSPDPVETARQAMARASGRAVELRRSRLTRLATFVTAPGGVPVQGGSAEERALGFLTEYGSAFGLKDASELRLDRTQPVDRVGMEHVRYRQLHDGVPVTGAEITVHLRGSRVIAVNGRALGTLAGFDTAPDISAAAAK